MRLMIRVIHGIVKLKQDYKKNVKGRLISMVNTKKVKKSVVALAFAIGLLVLGGSFAISNIMGSSMSVYVTTSRTDISVTIPVTSQSGSEWYANLIPSTEGLLSISGAEIELNAQEAAKIAANAIERFFAHGFNGNTIDMYIEEI